MMNEGAGEMDTTAFGARMEDLNMNFACGVWHGLDQLRDDDAEGNGERKLRDGEDWRSRNCASTRSRSSGPSASWWCS